MARKNPGVGKGVFVDKIFPTRAVELACLAVLAGLLALAVPGTGWAGNPPARADYIPLAEIRPGMTGYGLTVFAGARVDTFGVTVIGVQENIRAAGSLLLIEVSGHGLERSSIAQGMSGSPIYLDGRFAGALAFGWGGSLRPIAGVTPAAEMLELPTELAAGPTGARSDSAVDLAALAADGTDAEALAAAIWPADGVQETSGVGAGRPADWPGAPEMWLRLAAKLGAGTPALRNSADQWLFQPLGAAVAGVEEEGASQNERLVPGAACAVPLVVGDASLGAIGTVTWVNGDEVLMMGHPFMQRGPLDLPLATASVLTVLPSRQMSFKMGSIGKVIGTVHHDLRAGLAGTMGEAPALIPVTVTVRHDGAAARDYHFQVAADPMLTSALIFWSVYNAVLVTGDDASLQTLRYRVESTWSGPEAVSGQPLVLNGIVAGPGGAAGLARELITPLNALLNNPYAAVHLEGVQADLEQTRSLQTATVVGLNSPGPTLRAGQEVVIRAVVAPRQGPRETVDFPVRLPAQLAAGPYRLVVASAAELFALESQRAGGRFQPESLAGIMDILRTGRSASTLVLALFAPGQALVLQGQELANLPPSIARTVQTGNLQAQRSLADYVLRVEKATDWAVDGHAVRTLQIQPARKPVTEERRP